MKKTILVVGASRGIGAAVAKYFHDVGHRVIGVSRTPSVVSEWIEADISTADGISSVLNNMGETQIDSLLFMGGVWEEKAFTEAFDFRQSSEQETRQVIATNLIAPIEITKGLAQNLAASSNPRAIYMGALSGLDQATSPQVAYTASKFGLRGAIQALRIALKSENIGFTVINPGNVATDEVLTDIKEGRFKEQIVIPMEDLISTIVWLLSLSNAVEVGDINLIQRDQA